LNRVSNASRTMALFFAAIDLLILPSLLSSMSSAFRFRIHRLFPDIRCPVKTRILAVAKRVIWIIVIIHLQD
jgi:TetR/AcrR family transcriptional regulator, transcriptional repressor for nem operon